jgi:DNA-binding NarL/FixJ family response regulator
MRPRVLVVDDQEVLARAVARLIDDDYEMQVATAASVLQILERASFEAIITDVLMPVLSGIQLYRWLRLARPRLVGRVIFMTGLDGQVAGDLLGPLPNPLLLKPFKRDALVLALETVIARGTSRAASMRDAVQRSDEDKGPAAHGSGHDPQGS